MVDTALERHDPEDGPPLAFFAHHSGRCCRCRKRFPKGAAIVNEGLHNYAHLDCVEAGVEREDAPSTEEQLERALHALRVIARLTGAGNSAEPDEVIPDVHDAAVEELGRQSIERRRA